MENIYFRKEKQMQPTLQILGYLPLIVPSEKRQVTISDGKCRTAYCCNIYKNELFDELSLNIRLLIKQFKICNNILVILEFDLAIDQVYRIVGTPKRLILPAASAALVAPAAPAASAYLPIANVTNINRRMIHGKLKVNKTEIRKFIDAYGKDAKVLNFTIADNSGIISVCAYSTVLDKFITEIEVKILNINIVLNKK